VPVEETTIGYGREDYGSEYYGHEDNIAEGNYAYNLTFFRRQAPEAAKRPYGPVNLGSNKGYTVIRFRTRQFTMRVEQTRDVRWTFGKLRLRMKPGGSR
jgi:hypothetical protein